MLQYATGGSIVLSLLDGVEFQCFCTLINHLPHWLCVIKQHLLWFDFWFELQTRVLGVIANSIA
jgi:hypothetical protein